MIIEDQILTMELLNKCYVHLMRKIAESRVFLSIFLTNSK
jgi:hypothetical protein